MGNFLVIQPSNSEKKEGFFTSRTFINHQTSIRMTLIPLICASKPSSWGRNSSEATRFLLLGIITIRKFAPLSRKTNFKSLLSYKPLEANRKGSDKMIRMIWVPEPILLNSSRIERGELSGKTPKTIWAF